MFVNKKLTFSLFKTVKSVTIIKKGSQCMGNLGELFGQGLRSIRLAKLFCFGSFNGYFTYPLFACTIPVVDISL